METEDIAIILVVLVILGIVAYILYTNYSAPQSSGHKAQSGQIEAPSPFNPLEKAGNFEIFTEPPENEACMPAGPRVAF